MRITVVNIPLQCDRRPSAHVVPIYTILRMRSTLSPISAFDDGSHTRTARVGLRLPRGVVGCGISWTVHAPCAMHDFQLRLSENNDNDIKILCANKILGGTGTKNPVSLFVHGCENSGIILVKRTCSGTILVWTLARI